MTDDLARYHRQMLLPDFGADGQRSLLKSKVLLLGCGALGSTAADLLARAGVGHLVIVDRDFVETSNLQRQVLFDEQDIADAMPKAEAARRRLADINSSIRITAVVDDINHRNIEQLADGADLIVDGLDNFETRYIANDLAVRDGIPYIYGGAIGTVGMACAIVPDRDDDVATPCLHCLFDEPPPAGTTDTCDTAGVIGPVVSMIASFQVSETLKILSGNRDQVNPALLNIDLWHNTFLQLKTNRSDNCPCCKHREFRYLSGERGSSGASLCGRDAVQITGTSSAGAVDLPRIAARLQSRADVQLNDYLLRATVEDDSNPYEVTLFRDGRAIIKGTDNIDVAKGLFSKFIGN